MDIKKIEDKRIKLIMNSFFVLYNIPKKIYIRGNIKYIPLNISLPPLIKYININKIILGIIILKIFFILLQYFLLPMFFITLRTF